MQRDGNNAAAGINNLATTNIIIEAGKIDKGFTFSSSSTSKSDNLTLITNQITVCFWFKFASTAVSILCEYTINANTYKGFFVDINEYLKGQIVFNSKGNNGYNMIQTKKTYNDNKWHHFAGVINRNINNQSQQFIYIDGVADYKITPGYNNINTSNFPSSGHSMYIGSRATTSLKYIGSLDDFQFYTTALSIENIKRVMLGMHPL